MEENLLNKLRHLEELDRSSLPSLKKMMEDYPYFQVPRLLYLYILHKDEDAGFKDELRSSSVYITDRQALYALLSGEYEQGLRLADDRTLSHDGKDGRKYLGEDTTDDSAGVIKNSDNASGQYKVEKEVSSGAEKKDAENSSGRSFSLIDDFLSEYAGSGENEGLSYAIPNEAGADYTSSLLDLPDRGTSAPVNSDKKETNVVASEQVNAPASRPIPKREKDVVDVVQPVVEANEGVSDKYFTETLAKIYVKQGKYSKALEIIQRLYLREPNKNTYFADQIRYLEKLLINSRGQATEDHSQTTNKTK